MAHILVIDDEAPIRALARQILEAAGYQVSEAADGAAGITLLRTLPIALLITDIFMPRQEGIQTIRGGSQTLSPGETARDLGGVQAHSYEPVAHGPRAWRPSYACQAVYPSGVAQRGQRPSGSMRRGRG
jgi:ActR/RegA family two-component response regulator